MLAVLGLDTHAESVYRAMLALWAKGEPVDGVTPCEQCHSR